MHPYRNRWLTVLLCRLIAVSLWTQTTYGSHFISRVFFDRATGIATSLETSDIPTHSNLSAWLKNEKSSSIARKIFQEYPSWLCQGGITLGLLKAESYSYGRNKHRVRVHDRLFGINVITFGQPTSSSLQLKHQKNNSCSATTKVELPIVGGCLVSRPTDTDTCSGCLQFILQTSSVGVARLETGIAGDYFPALVGQPPVLPIRAWVYQSTQSMVHSYIMWRFHQHCYHQEGELKIN